MLATIVRSVFWMKNFRMERMCQHPLLRVTCARGKRDDLRDGKMNFVGKNIKWTFFSFSLDFGSNFNHDSTSVDFKQFSCFSRIRYWYDKGVICEVQGNVNHKASDFVACYWRQIYEIFCHSFCHVRTLIQFEVNR